MEKNIETEYKVLVSKEAFSKLLSFYPDAHFIKQTNTYFDNAQQTLKQKHGAMRIREKGNFVFTLKMPSAEGLLEYECPVSSSCIEELSNKEICNLLKEYEITEPYFETAKLVTHRAVIDTGYAELCFDKNQYGNHTDYEIEYEITKPHDSLNAFLNILKQANLTYEKNCDSKIKRALDALCQD